MRLNQFILLFCLWHISSFNLFAQHSILLPIEVNNKYGYIDTSGEMVIKPQFDLGFFFHENGTAFVMNYEKKNKRYFMINASGNQIGKEIYEEYDFYYRVNKVTGAIVKKNGKYGIIDSLSNELVPFIYDKIDGFRSGIAIAIKNNQKGYLDSTLQFTSLDQYRSIYNMSLGFIAVVPYDQPDTLFKQIWIYNTQTKKVELGPYEDINHHKNFCYGVLTLYQRGGRNVIINTKGEEIFSPRKNYHIYNTWTDSVFIVSEFRDNGRIGLIDKHGNFLIKPTKKFEDLQNFKIVDNRLIGEFVIKNSVGKKWYGIVSATGEIIIDAIFENLIILDKEKLKVKKNNKWGIYDWMENEIVPCIYDEIYFLNDHIIRFSIGQDYDEQMGYYNIKTHRMIYGPIYRRHR
jgi:hypothetical protein